MENLTSFTSEFLLLEFSRVQELQILHFLVFLALYLTALMGNLFIIVIIAIDYRLHTPMYFFLMNLAICDLGTICVTVPKSMFNSLMNSRLISYSECVSQVFFLLFFETSDLIILTIMAHDRHVAICSPLQYEVIMNREACIQMVAIAWGISLLYATLHTGTTFSVTFCSNAVDQFFCEIPRLLKLSCSNLYLVEVGFLALCAGAVIGCFSFIIATYVRIFSAVYRIPSVLAQQKALSTCLPHLLVVSLLISTGLFVYARPPSNISSTLDLLLAVLYAIVPPMLNPFIYSMRNKEIQTALWRLLNLKHFSNTTPRLVTNC
ncbi:olfactory receptor 14A16-like [Varanus komodoensis]|uniref:G-protein coupled receptors family 1 profile domain-containing protein n=1 Tax=Varanus komodoensis TaxID=61221 RepID=A0A8D2IMQ2_VARKO|nr:olfactory receptor 14A16-like [Varanus komodoensis]